ncbi:hypothethical protein [Ralstonia solanacearum PSI07]|nr:hypothethical protein [Ralstonia solanacearum PSI07]
MFAVLEDTDVYGPVPPGARSAPHSGKRARAAWLAAVVNAQGAGRSENVERVRRYAHLSVDHLAQWAWQFFATNYC